MSKNRYAKFFLSKVLESPSTANVFKDIFGNKDQFLTRLRNVNQENMVLDLLQFAVEILGKPSTLSNCSSPSNQFSLSPRDFGKPPANFLLSGPDENFSKIYSDSQNLAEKLQIQRKKIEKTYENMKEAVVGSKNLRPVSAFNIRVITPDDSELFENKL